MLDHATLTAAGYIFDTFTYSKDMLPLYQKRIQNEGLETLYFIEILDHKNAFDNIPNIPQEHLENNRYSCSVVLYTNTAWMPKCQHRVSVEVNANTTIVQIEAHIAQIFVALGCIPNPHN